MRLFPRSGQQPILARLYWCGYNKFCLNKKSQGKKKKRSFHKLYLFSNQSKERYPSSKDSSLHLNPGKILDVLNKIIVYRWCFWTAVLWTCHDHWCLNWWRGDGLGPGSEHTAWQLTVSGKQWRPHIEQESELSIDLGKISAKHPITSWAIGGIIKLPILDYFNIQKWQFHMVHPSTMLPA